MSDKASRARVQYAALPFAVSASGRARVMLVTSRGGRRWVIPKGMPIRHLSAPEVAAREAYEEAGLVGQVIGRRPVGSYRYVKRGGPKKPFAVTVFLMHVDRQLDAWPERGRRRTAWFDFAAAARVVEAEGLADILRRMSHNFGQVLDDVLTGPEMALPALVRPRPRKVLTKLMPLAPTRPVWPYASGFSEI
jgi:8-oxo-dGTP pyrophosphatase MutT (NUDIX family)